MVPGPGAAGTIEVMNQSPPPSPIHGTTAYRLLPISSCLLPIEYVFDILSFDSYDQYGNMSTMELPHPTPHQAEAAADGAGGEGHSVDCVGCWGMG